MTEVFAQRRLNRPPSGRELEGTPILAAGTSVIPDGTVLIIEMDSRLDSGTAQPSDRFLARIATPVVDESGRTLLPAGALIEGHVTAVKKAKWRHRSGELGLSFDYIEFGDGRRILLRGTLVSPNNRIDEEGNLKAKSATRRDIIISTGGAAAGAGVGLVTGASILAGGGLGAAAGLTVALLIKGKDVVIDPGDRLNLQLVQPLYLTSAGNFGQRSGTGSRGRVPIPLQPGARTGGTSRGFIPGSSSGGASSNNPNSVRTVPGLVAVHDVRAERDRDGYLRVLVTAETPSNGWRIYTHHEIPSRDTLDIRLRGVPPSGYGSRGVSHPSAPTILVEDRNSAIRRIVVRGSNGDRYLSLGSGSTAARLDSNQSNARTFPSNSQTPPRNPPLVRPRTGSGPSDGSSINLGFPSSTGNSSRSSSSLSALATQVANQIEVFRSNYAGDIGLWMNRDGTIDEIGQRRPGANERLFFDTLGDLHNSARTLATPSLDTYTRQQSGQRFRNDLQTAQQLWQRVRSTGVVNQDRDRQWQRLQNDLRALSDSSGR
ncbi:MAG: hypothetical protein AB7U82_04250 [Blastocatellales bacterium]